MSNHRVKFETSILETCSRVNASENFRGINYKFSKNGYDLVRADKSFAVRKSVYASIVLSRFFRCRLIITLL